MSTHRRDPMRAFAWLCVVGGLLITLGAVAYVPYRDAAIRREIARLGVQAMLPASVESDRAAALRTEQFELSHWPAVITGASVTAFGILLLAIRRPEKA